MSALPRSIVTLARSMNSFLPSGKILAVYRCTNGCCKLGSEWTIDAKPAAQMIALCPQFACAIAKGARQDSFILVMGECRGDGSVNETLFEISRKKR